jgi:hypothetical protein
VPAVSDKNTFPWEGKIVLIPRHRYRRGTPTESLVIGHWSLVISGQKVVRRWSEGCDFGFVFLNLFGAWDLVLGISLAFGAWCLEFIALDAGNPKLDAGILKTQNSALSTLRLPPLDPLPCWLYRIKIRFHGRGESF